jgi:WS/DGAT/MGAT family acyltransferase
MDRAANLMVINSVLLFDEPLYWQQLTDVVRTRLVDAYPRFRQRVAESRLVPGGPRWVQDTRFDISRHLHRRGLAAPAGESALQDLIGDLASTPLDRGKPLWDMYLVDGPAGGSTVIVRMHHCIADGIALAQVLLSLADPDSHPPSQSRSEPHAEQTPSRACSGSMLRALPGVPMLLARQAVKLLAHPRRALELADELGADGRALAKLLTMSRDSQPALSRAHGVTRCVAWSRPLSLAQVKAVALAQEATVNDVLLAALSGALRSYVSSRGEQPQTIRTLVPFNLRPREEPVAPELGNRFGLVFVALPVERSSRRERLREVKRSMDAIKGSAEGAVTYALLEAMGLGPSQIEGRVLDIFSARASAVTTNVPGPARPVRLAGGALRTVLVWAPTAGSVSLSVSMFSYGGQITVGVLAHTQIVSDPQALVDRLQRELTAMAKLAPAARGRAA